MTAFSDKIKQVIDESGYTVYQISKGAGIGRTSIYKMMTGKLLPNREFMNRFYHYIRLRPSERKELERLYYIEKDGRERYENRLFIKQMLEGIQYTYPVDDLTLETSSEMMLTQEIGHSKNQFKTLELISIILKKEMNAWETPFISMNLPIRNKCIFDLLYQHCQNSKKQFCVKQLVMLNQNPAKTKDANSNLKILHRVLPFVQTFSSQYQIRSCYTKCDEGDSYAFFWPYYLITHDYVVMISNDGTSAYLQKEKSIVKRYQEEFHILYESSEQLLIQHREDVQVIERYFNNYTEYGMPDYILRSGPNLVHMLSHQN